MAAVKPEFCATRPLVVLVSGAPGSGKTTLAERLGTEVGLPVLTKDMLKEVLYDTVGVPDQTSASRFGSAAFALLACLAERLVAAGVSTVVEANYQRGLSEGGLTPLLEQARVVLVHCGGDAETIVRRYEARARSGVRHPGHDDLAAIPRLRQLLDANAYEPLNLDVPLLRVDTTTTAEYGPDFATITQFVRNQLLLTSSRS